MYVPKKLHYSIITDEVFIADTFSGDYSRCARNGRGYVATSKQLASLCEFRASCFHLVADYLP